MPLNNNQQVFFALLRAGLWGTGNTDLRICEAIDWEEVYQLAQEQSVQGVVLQGIEELRAKNLELRVPQVLLLQWIGEVQIMADQNKSMNEFVASLIETLSKNDIHPILVKGQGIAQCYEKPLWRASGDVDLLLSEQDYEKAKKVLLPSAIDVGREYKSFKHQGMTMQGGYVVELHGTMHSRLSKRVDRGIDEAQKDVFFGVNVRSWQNGNMQIFLPGPDNDVIFVFTHILHHFYIEGIGLRQICDWCKLMWTYRDSLNHGLLEKRIRKMGLMSEWRAFAAFVVEYLGMPVEAMPLYNANVDLNANKKKAKHILKFVLESGNFGLNREKTHGKMQSAWSKIKDFSRHARIFPLDSFKFFWHFLWNGVGLMVEK